MPLPTEIDIKVRKRFNDLVIRCEQLANVDQLRIIRDNNNLSVEFYAVRTQFLSLIELISPSKDFAKRISDDVRKLDEYRAKSLLGNIQAVKADYEEGLLDKVTRLIEANVNADYMALAEQLYKEGKLTEPISHLPAAVLAGAVLEDALRRLCARQTPTVTTVKRNGEPKMMMALIDELRDVGIYNELLGSKLRHWAHIRNKAAHGEFGEFKRSDVDEMLKGIRTFITDYL